jgi:hypothetical protein
MTNKVQRQAPPIPTITVRSWACGQIGSRETLSDRIAYKVIIASIIFMFVSFCVAIITIATTPSAHASPPRSWKISVTDLGGEGHRHF